MAMFSRQFVETYASIYQCITVRCFTNILVTMQSAASGQSLLKTVQQNFCQSVAKDCKLEYSDPNTWYATDQQMETQPMFTSRVR